MQRRLTPVEIVLVGLELVLIAGAVGGAVGMLASVDGRFMGWTTEMLASTPFDDFRVPGVVLLVVNGLFPGAVVGATLRRRPGAAWGHLAVGLVLTGWIAGQVWMIGYSTVLQPVFGALGLVLAGLGLVTVRQERARRRGPP